MHGLMREGRRVPVLYSTRAPLRPACARGVQVPEPFSADEKVVEYFKRILVG